MWCNDVRNTFSFKERLRMDIPYYSSVLFNMIFCASWTWSPSDWKALYKACFLKTYQTLNHRFSRWISHIELMLVCPCVNTIECWYSKWICTIFTHCWVMNLSIIIFQAVNFLNLKKNKRKISSQLICNEYQKPVAIFGRACVISQQ